MHQSPEAIDRLPSLYHHITEGNALPPSYIAFGDVWAMHLKQSFKSIAKFYFFMLCFVLTKTTFLLKLACATFFLLKKKKPTKFSIYAQPLSLAC